jgi:hypothetical protein
LGETTEPAHGTRACVLPASGDTETLYLGPSGDSGTLHMMCAYTENPKQGN